MGRVQDQVAVVTGAANGLGKSIALRLAENGARVVLGDIDGPGLAATATAVREVGGEAVTVVGDITEEEPAAQLIESAIEHYKQIDILVNNVGGSRNSKIWQMSVEDWDYTIKLNLRGTFLCTRAAVPHMRKRSRGRSFVFRLVRGRARLGRLTTRVGPPIRLVRRAYTGSCAILHSSWRSSISV